MLKRVMILLLICVCTYDIINKLVKKNSYKSELTAAAQYVETINEINTTNETVSTVPGQQVIEQYDYTINK
jgi:hypothetical protein